MDFNLSFDKSVFLPNLQRKLRRLSRTTTTIKKSSLTPIVLSFTLVAISLLGGVLIYRQMKENALLWARERHLPKIEQIQRFLIRLGYFEVIDASILDYLKRSSVFGDIEPGTFWISENQLWIRVDQAEQWSDFIIFSQLRPSHLMKKTRRGKTKFARKHEALPKRWVRMGNDWGAISKILSLAAESPPYTPINQIKSGPKKKAIGYHDPREIVY